MIKSEAKELIRCEVLRFNVFDLQRLEKENIRFGEKAKTELLQRIKQEKLASYVLALKENQGSLNLLVPASL
ncbi:hypothetical protein [Vibrio sonorensis]|uniref:hypothetical protein n=1 Tax=Vibrio sonorensis TaxID=1004316 RepID=UPI0011144844|nr:hypothetical protein [Vibrio sonorensis]